MLSALEAVVPRIVSFLTKCDYPWENHPVKGVTCVWQKTQTNETRGWEECIRTQAWSKRNCTEKCCGILFFFPRNSRVPVYREDSFKPPQSKHVYPRHLKGEHVLRPPKEGAYTSTVAPLQKWCQGCDMFFLVSK